MQLSIWSAGAALALAALAVPATAGEFELLRLGDDNVKWGEPELGSGATITYAFAERSERFDNARNCREIAPFESFARETGFPVAAIRREFEAALAAWEAVADVRFRAAPDPAAADILVGAQAEPRGRAFANVTPLDRGATERAAGDHGGLPVYTAGLGPRGRTIDIAPIEQSLVCLNASAGWKIGFDGDAEVYDLRYTFMHEVGHALGLDHPSASGELMSFRYDESFRLPQDGDIAGVRRLYGPRRTR